MEQLVILVLIGLVSFINWLVQKSAEQREKRKAEADAQGGSELRQAPANERPADTGDEAARRLREALGLPDDEDLPPPMPRREIPVPPQFPDPIRSEPALPPVPAFLREARAAMDAVPRPVAARMIAPKHAPAPPAIVSRAEPSRFRALLASPSGARDAVVLAEILGTPKGFQNL